jgi:hypothetical protein
MVMNVLLFKISFYMKGCLLNMFCGLVHVLTRARQQTLSARPVSSILGVGSLHSINIQQQVTQTKYVFHD